jgi:hypothetical protein
MGPIVTNRAMENIVLEMSLNICMPPHGWTRLALLKELFALRFHLPVLGNMFTYFVSVF